MANNENLIKYKKGVSGNLKGRPKGTRNKSTIFKEFLNSKVDNGLTTEQILLKKVYELVQKGDLNAIKMVFDCAYGKDKVSVEQTTINIKPPKISFFDKK